MFMTMVKEYRRNIRIQFFGHSIGSMGTISPEVVWASRFVSESSKDMEDGFG